MKTFDQLLSAIGLSSTHTVVNTGGKVPLVYEYDQGAQTGTPGITIRVNASTCAIIARSSWDAAATVYGHQRGPNLMIMQYWDKVLSSAGRQYVTSSRWFCQLKQCETDLFVYIDHDSDPVTKSVTATLDVIVASLQSYL